MSNRHLARTIAVQTLYQWDFNEQKKDIKEIMLGVRENFAPEFDDGQFINHLIEGVVKNLKAIVATEQSRIKKLSEIVSATEFFFKAPDYDPQLLIWKKLNAKETAKNLAALAEELEKIKEKEWTEKFIEAEIKKFIEGNKQGMGDYLWPMRAALSGRKASPGPFEIAGVLGREETLKRLEKAIEILIQ